MPNSVNREINFLFLERGLNQLNVGVTRLNSNLNTLNNTRTESVQTTRAASAANDTWSKTAKGAAGIAGSQTKAFSKMSQGMTSNLVPAYATLAANIFAVSAAFRVLKDAADFTRLQQASDEFSKSLGVNLKGIAKSIRSISDESITMQKAMRTASIASAAGFDSATIDKLAKAARNASVALGRDMTDSLDRVFSGALKAEPELLDELGIILRLKPATEAYAKVLGKAASQLTTFEKQTAVVNEVIKQAEEKFGHLGKVMDEGNSFAVLQAKALDAVKTALSGINVILEPFISLLTRMDYVLLGIAAVALPKLLSLFGKQATNVMQSFANNAIHAADAVRALEVSATQSFSSMQSVLQIDPGDSIVESMLGDSDAIQKGIDEVLGLTDQLKTSMVFKPDTTGIQKLIFYTDSLKLALMPLNVALAQTKASLISLSSGFAIAMTSTATFSAQVSALKVQMLSIWGSGTGGAGFLGATQKMGMLGGAMASLAPLAVGAGKAIGFLAKSIPFIGIAMIAFEGLKFVMGAVSDLFGLGNDELDRSLTQVAESADLAREAIERLGVEAELNLKTATNAVNSLFEGMDRLKRSVEGYSASDSLLSLGGLLGDTRLTETSQVLEETAESLGKLLEKLGSDAPSGMANRLRELAIESKNLDGNTAATAKSVSNLVDKLNEERVALVRTFKAMEAAKENPFEGITDSFHEFILEGKDATSLMEALKKAQTDLINNSYITSDAINVIADAMGNLVDTSAIDSIHDYRQAIVETKADLDKYVTFLDSKKANLSWYNFMEVDEIDNAIAHIGAEAISSIEKFQNAIRDLQSRAKAEATELLRVFESIMTAASNVKNASTAANLVTVTDTTSLEIYLRLSDRVIDNLREEAEVTELLLQDEARKGEAASHINELKLKELDILQQQLDVGKGLLQESIAYEETYARLVGNILPKIREILRDNLKLTKEEASVIATSMAMLESAPGKEEEESNNDDTLSFYDQEMQRLLQRNILIGAGERAAYAYNLELRKVTPEEKKQLLLQFDKNKAVEKLAADEKKAAILAKAKTKSALSSLKSIRNGIKDVGATSLDLFSKGSGITGGITDMVQALMAMTTELKNNEGAINDNAKAKSLYLANSTDTATQVAEQEEEFNQNSVDLAEKSTAAKIQGAIAFGGAMIGILDSLAAAQEEGSKKQEAIQKASLGLQMVMALAMASLAIIRGFATGGWPLAISVAIATAAQLATLGVAMASIGSGPDTKSLQETQGRGSVLGDPEALSESLGNSMDTLEDYASIGNDTSSKMLTSLISIDSSLKSTALGVFRSETFKGFGINPAVGASSFTGAPVDRLLSQDEGGMLSSSEFNIKDVGINFDSVRTLGDIAIDGIQSSYFAIVDSWEKKMLLFKTNSQTNEFSVDTENSIDKWFSDIVTNMAEATVEGMQVLYKGDIQDIIEELNNTELGIDKISLAGMDLDEMNEALAAIFSKMGDELVLSVSDSFELGLHDFQQVGEGLFETFVRVAAETEAASSALAVFGLTAIDYTEVLNKQNDVAPQIVKQTILMNEEWDNIAEIMGYLQGDAAELVDTWGDLRDVQRQLIGLGFDEALLSADLINAMGGSLSGVSSGISDFLDGFFTDQERFNIQLTVMRGKFQDLGLTMPTTLSSFRRLTESIGNATPEATILTGILISMSGEMKDLYDAWDKLLEPDDVEELEEEVEKLFLTWKTATKEAEIAGETLLESATRLHAEAFAVLEVFDGTDEAIENVQRAMDARYEAELNLINGIRDAIESIDNKISDTVQDMALVGLSDEELYKYYSTEAEAIANEIRNGDYASPEEISEAANAAIGAATTAFNLLDEAGQIENREQFTSFLEGIGQDSTAYLKALESIAINSTIDLYEETLEVVGIDSIESDIGSILEIMRNPKAQADFNNVIQSIVQKAITATQPVDIASIIDSSLTASADAGLSGDALLLDASESIVDTIQDLIPAAREILLQNPDTAQFLATFMSDTFQDRVNEGYNTSDAFDLARTATIDNITTSIEPYLPTYDIPLAGQDTYDYFADNEVVESQVVADLTSSATNQVEASNTILEASTIMLEAAEAMQDLDFETAVPVYIEPEGVVGV